MARRWQVTDDEWERIRRARSHRLTPFAAAKLLAAHPRILLEVLRDLAPAARRGVFQSSPLVWVIDTQRARTVVSDLARGALFSPARPFLDVLVPWLEPWQRVLDLGGGDGRLAIEVAPRVRELVCADPSRTMVREARENLAGVPNAAAQLLPPGPLPFIDECFDLVYAQGVLSWIDVNEGLALLDEATRVLAPGGLLFANVLTLDRPEWVRRQLGELRRANRLGRYGAGIHRSYFSAQAMAMAEAVGLELVGTGFEDDTGRDDEWQSPFYFAGRKPASTGSETTGGPSPLSRRG